MNHCKNLHKTNKTAPTHDMCGKGTEYHPFAKFSIPSAKLSLKHHKFKCREKRQPLPYGRLL